MKNFGRILVLCFVLAAMAGCNAPKPEDEVPIIRTGSEFEAELNKCEELSEGPLRRYDQGDELSSSERENLRLALNKFKGLMGYQPGASTLYLGAGKIQQVFGEHEDAIRLFDEGASYIDETSMSAEQKRTLAEFYYQAARSYEARLDFESTVNMAGKALMLYPENPDFLSTSASGHLQTNKVAEARKEIALALRIDPNHKRAKQLDTLLKQ